jgi:hypothetical protein
MNKKNVILVEKDKTTQCFSYEVKMLVHVIGTNEEDAKKELDEKGGIVTKREVQLLNTVTLYGEKDTK